MKQLLQAVRCFLRQRGKEESKDRGVKRKGGGEGRGTVVFEVGTDGVKATVFGDDTDREERKRQRESFERVCSSTGAGCISSRTNSLPLGVSCWRY